jgi:septal ring factor EnvC (AmiA/AmiB activator)
MVSRGRSGMCRLSCARRCVWRLLVVASLILRGLQKVDIEVLIRDLKTSKDTCGKLKVDLRDVQKENEKLQEALQSAPAASTESLELEKKLHDLQLSFQEVSARLQSRESDIAALQESLLEMHPVSGLFSSTHVIALILDATLADGGSASFEVTRRDADLDFGQ